MLNPISVVIPFYNGNRYFHECLDSVAAQSLQPLEVIIVVDNDSELPCLPSNYPIDVKIIKNPEAFNGAGICRYYGFEEAQGDFVCFLDPDDLWVENKLKLQLSAVLKRKLVFSFGSYENFRENVILSTITPKAPYTLDNFLKKTFTVGCATVMIDKFSFNKIEPNYLKRRNDYYMWWQIITKLDSSGIKWGGVEEILSRHRIHDNALTKSKVKSAIGYWKYLSKIKPGAKQKIIFFVFYLKNTIRERLLS
jgi:teichuronic acid biosynthesis glycosyltransferase TuaG